VLGGRDESSGEQALRSSDLGWTLLAPVEFMSGALERAGSIREHGLVRMLAARCRRPRSGHRRRGRHGAHGGRTRRTHLPGHRTAVP
jgi:uncharacterized protein YbjT (DUF2867 family)